MSSQNYPRIYHSSHKKDGLLDIVKLVPHTRKLSREEMVKLVQRSIRRANQKSSREHFSLSPGASPEETVSIYQKAGKELFKYFKQYCGDPATTARQIFGRHYLEVAQEEFHNRTVQKGRMNSGWRYQFLLLDCAISSNRFQRISDIGTAEADFNAVIDFIEPNQEPLNLYVSVKNRRNTMGGQDWPKAIAALEKVASNDRNRVGYYCCVFAIAMDKGERYIKTEQKSGRPHSVNTEIWLSDFLWPFFANYAYEEIMSFVLDVLLDSDLFTPTQLTAPTKLLYSFGEECTGAGLIDQSGTFHDPHKLVSFFCK